MSTLEFRLSCPEDIGQMKTLWQLVFGDTVEYIHNFFNALHDPGTAIVCLDSKRVVAMVHLLDAGMLTVSRPLRISYTYALATHPDYRRMGIATRLLDEAKKQSARRGFDANILCPAEESLFVYYKKRDYFSCFFIQEAWIKAASDLRQIEVTPLSTAEYMADRLLYLGTDMPQLTVPVRVIDYVRTVTEAQGGGLFRLAVNGQAGVAAVGRNNDELFFHEILGTFLIKATAQSLCRQLSAVRALVRTQPFKNAEDFLNTRPFGMISYANQQDDFAGYFPFALDL